MSPRPLDDAGQLSGDSEMWAELTDSPAMPESVAWRRLCDGLANQRPTAAAEALGMVRGLLAQREQGVQLSIHDLYSQEHQRATSPELARVWQTYKHKVLAGDWSAARAELDGMAKLCDQLLAAAPRR